MYGNGDVFEGMWANDKKHGPGSFFYMSRGKRLDGVWHEDVVRAGTYGEIHAPAPGAQGTLPPIELKDPEGVLASATQVILTSL